MPEQPLRNQVAVVAVRTDHTVESEVEQLFARVRAEAGRLDVLVNDIWGGDALTEWGKPFWELSIASDLHAHHVTALAITPGFPAVRGRPRLLRGHGAELARRHRGGPILRGVRDALPGRAGRGGAGRRPERRREERRLVLYLDALEGVRPDRCGRPPAGLGHLLPAQGAGDLDGPSQIAPCHCSSTELTSVGTAIR